MMVVTAIYAVANLTSPSSCMQALNPRIRVAGATA